MKKKFIIIDSNALIHRAYHALPPLTTKKGELVNAVYGYTSVLLNVMSRFKAEYIAAAFDLKAPTFRHKEFEEYKATRVKAPDDLYEQIPKAKEMAATFNIPILEKEGYEADDLIATIARRIEKTHPEIEVIIVTGDLDTLQLVSPAVKVFALRKGMGDSALYDEKAVAERFGGLRPNQMVDYKGLRGDPSDNLPGVKGVGEKTAVELLRKYENIEEIYKNLSEIKEGIGKKLEKDKVQAFFSRRLAKLIEDIPLKFELEKCRFDDFSRVKVINLLKSYEFFSLMRRLPGYEKFEKREEQRGGKIDGLSLNDISVKKIEFSELGKIINGQKKLSFFCEEENSAVVGIGIAFSKTDANYLRAQDIEKLMSKLQEDSFSVDVFDAKQEMKKLARLKADFPQYFFDSMLVAYLLNPGKKIDWEELVLENLGILLEKNQKKSGQGALVFRDEEEAQKKASQKAALIFALADKLREKLESIKSDQVEDGRASTLENVFENIEIPLVLILRKMEEAGIRINQTVLKGISAKLDEKVKKIEKEIQKLAGEDFNVNSSVQLRDILFEKLKISSDEIKRGKTGFSTASSELQKIKHFHPIVEKIEEYRELFKLKTTYLDPLPLLVDEKSRLHTTFNQAVTATGRLSSSEPNLQNIPIRTELGQLIRTAFEAEEGYRLVGADYSQIELRIVAHLSGDVRMITTFLNQEDIHRATAERVNKVKLEKVTEKMRSAAKALNFGIIYGMSTFGFAQSAGIDQEDAREFIRKYFLNYPQVAQFLEEVKISAREKGYVETELGRRRYISEITSKNFQLRAQAERMAVNMPVQGLAADIIKLAMIAVDKLIGEKYPRVRMVLQIHDELLFEVPEKEAEIFARDIKEAMEGVYKLSVPLIVDVKTGDNWGET